MAVKTETLAHPTTASAQSWLLSAVNWWGLLLLTLHLAAFQLDEEMAWSLWPYTMLPRWLGWALALLAAALILPPLNHRLAGGIQRLWSVWPAKHARRRWFAAAALLAGLLFWLFRLRHLRWGDAYVLTVALAYDGPGGPLIYNWQAPLTVFIHQRLWQFIASPLLGWPVEHVYAAVSIISGVVFVYILLSFTARLGRSSLETAVMAGLMLTTGAMQLFFGYVENYTLISLGLLITLFLAWRTLQGELPLLWPVLALALTNSFHPSTVFLWPGMGLLAWLCWQRGYVSTTGLLWQALAPPLLVGAGVLALMESGQHGLSELFGADRPGGGDGIWFVPLFETSTEWQHYTMFSAAHLLDWSNEHLLISPFGLPLFVLILIAAHRFRLDLFATLPEKDYALFLGAMSASYLLLTWLWNPDYGGRKDWDLFAPSAFVYTLLVGYLLVRVLTDKNRLREAGLFAITVSLLHSAAWVWTNTHHLPR
jgi:hypothetical protein